MFSATKIRVLLSGLALVAMACDPVPTGDDPIDGETALYHHRPDHGGGPGDGSIGGPRGNQQVTVEITGGLETGPNLKEVTEERKRRLLIDNIAGDQLVYLVLENTYAAAVDELTHPENPICEFRPADGAQAAKEELVAGLQVPRVRGSLAINHHDDRGSIGYNSTASGGPWLTLGINTQTGTIEDRAAIDYQGTDPLNASSERRFLFQAGTGIWRTLTDDGSGGLLDLICVNQDEFLAVVVPVTP